MPLTIPVSPTRPLSLDEFCDLLDADLDVDDEPTVLPAQAPRLASLMLDRRLVVEALVGNLCSLAVAGDGSRPNAFSGQSILLARRSRFVVRANIWTPRAARGIVAYEEEFAAYQVAHNHPVDFLTGGFWGSGYETVLHHYEPARDAVAPREGQCITLDYVGRARLGPGTVMHYDATHDVHHQKHAEDLSISINVIVRTPSTQMNRQLLFDARTSRVTAVADVNGGAQHGIVEIAELLLGTPQAHLFETIALDHGAPDLRIAAWRALAAIEPSRRDAITAMARRDSHPAVRTCLASDADAEAS